jgi:hypothetical protein
MFFVRNCLVYLLVFLGFYGLYFYALGKPMRSYALWPAIGIFIAFILLMQIPFFRRLSSLIKQHTNASAFQDGTTVAVCGRIYPIDGKPLISPLSRKECVAYEYAVENPSGRQRGTPDPRTFCGWRLTPSIIRNGDQETRLLAFPDMMGFENVSDIGDPRRNVIDYIGSTPFRIHMAKGEQFSKQFKNSIHQVNELLTDDDGTVRLDITHYNQRGEVSPDPDNPSLQQIRFAAEFRPELEAALVTKSLSETFIPVGDEVVLVGVWSATKGGIVSDALGKGGMARLIKGSREQVVDDLRVKIITRFIIAILIAVSINIALLLFIRGR